MAKGTDIPESMLDGLKQLVPDIAVIQATPDADIPFLDKLLKIVLLRIHQGQPGAQPGGSPPPAEATPGGAPAGPAGGAPVGMGMPGGPPGGGAANGQMASQGAPQAPVQPGGMMRGIDMGKNPDELRRILAENAGK
jgi:hypothetical protein